MQQACGGGSFWLDRSNTTQTQEGDVAEPIARPGGHVLWTSNLKATAADMNRAGTMANQALFNLLLARLLTETQAGKAASGCVGDDCRVTLVSGLDVQVESGLGLFLDETDTDEFGLVYQPVVVSAVERRTLDAHEAKARIDLVSIAPATEDDQDVSRYLKDPASGATSVQTVSLRRRFGSSVVVTKGTSSYTPVAPATPTGHIALAEIDIPATSGAITIRDQRARIVVGQDLPLDPPEDYVSDFVPGGTGSELAVSADAPAAMSVQVSPGEAVIGGHRYRYGAQGLAIATSDPSAPRSDVVLAADDGTLKVRTGEPNSEPEAPSLGAGEQALAHVAVAAGATQIWPANITDVREREPHDTAQLRDGAVTTAKLAANARSVVASLTFNTGGGGSPAVIDVQLEDTNGHAVEEQLFVAVECRGETFNLAGALSETGAGSLRLGTGTPEALLETSTAGAAQLTVSTLPDGKDAALLARVLTGNGGSSVLEFES